MIVTEEEAKTKRCQEMFLLNHSYDAMVNGPPTSLGPLNCLASACMAWRWQDNLSPVQQRGAYGYCGKAGRP